MKRICEQKLREAYEKKFPADQIFGFDIWPYTELVRFESEEALLSEGEEPKSLYYMIEGRARLFLSHENGKISLINFLDAPCFIGEMELLGAQSAAKGVTAITPCICCKIQITGCREKLLGDTKFLRHLCIFLSRKALDNTAAYSRNQSCPLSVRLADFILLTAHSGLYTEKHTEAAEYLGVSYRHLLYVLADFTKRGLLARTPQGYRILDEAALRAAAHERPD